MYQSKRMKQIRDPNHEYFFTFYFLLLNLYITFALRFNFIIKVSNAYNTTIST